MYINLVVIMAILDSSHWQFSLNYAHIIVADNLNLNIVNRKIVVMGIVPLPRAVPVQSFHPPTPHPGEGRVVFSLVLSTDDHQPIIAYTDNV